jgi:hypothetical protein
MTQEQFGFDGGFREVMLRGRSPIEYIQDEVDMLKRVHQESSAAWTPDDLAMALNARMKLGIIDEEEMEESLPYLGLTLEEADSLLGESMPKIRGFSAFQERATADAHGVALDIALNSSDFLIPQEKLIPRDRYAYIKGITENLTFKMPGMIIEQPKNPQDKQG